jgi:hypothetical protein
MTERYIAADEIEWHHPQDNPPPTGTKILLYFHPHGIAVIGQWQHSGASLWAPLPRVSREMRDRLDGELEARIFKRG